jgi:hypothetical protein
MRLYVVMGTTGEYSDRREWPVCAYEDETTAQKHVQHATDAAQRLMASVASYYDVTDAMRQANIYDTHVEFDYTGTRYFLYAVDVQERLPEPIHATTLERGIMQACTCTADVVCAKHYVAGRS